MRNESTGDVIRMVGVDLSGNFQIGVCVELFDPDSQLVGAQTCGDVSLQVDRTLTMTGVHTLLVTESGHNSAHQYNVSLTCLSGVCGPKLPVCEVGLAINGTTLEFNFTMRTATAATRHLWRGEKEWTQTPGPPSCRRPGAYELELTATNGEPSNTARVLVTFK